MRIFSLIAVLLVMTSISVTAQTFCPDETCPEGAERQETFLPKLVEGQKAQFSFGKGTIPVTRVSFVSPVLIHSPQIIVESTNAISAAPLAMIPYRYISVSAGSPKLANLSSVELLIRIEKAWLEGISDPRVIGVLKQDSQGWTEQEVTPIAGDATFARFKVMTSGFGVYVIGVLPSGLTPLVPEAEPAGQSPVAEEQTQPESSGQEPEVAVQESQQQPVIGVNRAEVVEQNPRSIWYILAGVMIGMLLVGGLLVRKHIFAS